MGGERKKRPASASDPQKPASASATDPADEIDAIFSRCKKPRASSLAADAAHEKKRKDQDEGDEPLKTPDGKRTKQTVQGSTKKMKEKKKMMKKKKKKEEEGERVGGKPPDPMKPRRKTEDGLAIYTEEDLGWNKKNAGGTKLCPFDCDCCF
jgi:hypothetical protein